MSVGFGKNLNDRSQWADLLRSLLVPRSIGFGRVKDESDEYGFLTLPGVCRNLSFFQ